MNFNGTDHLHISRRIIVGSKIIKKKVVSNSKNSSCKSIYYDSVYDIRCYIEANKSSVKNVRYKNKVQEYNAAPIFHMVSKIQKFQSKDYSADMNMRRATICERGKQRDIVPIAFPERVLEHIICDEILLPMFEKRLIYSNGASLKGKGTEFDRALMFKYVQKAARNNYEYVVKYDFKSYFESIPHKTIFDTLSRYIERDDVLQIIMNIILSYKHTDILLDYNNGKISEQDKNKLVNDLYDLKLHGVCLGSQISQILALIVPNPLDHHLKDKLGLKYYVRYMDDGIVLCKDKEEARFVLQEIKQQVSGLGLTLSDKKTYITKLSRGFTFLKVDYYVRDKKIIRKLNKCGIVRMRRKLNGLYRLVDSGVMTEQDAFNSIQSWWSHSFIASAFYPRINMLNKYKTLFDYKIDWFLSRLYSMKPRRINIRLEGCL